MLGPLACLALGIALILTLILVFRFHAFLALTAAAIAVAMLSDRIPLESSLVLVTTEFGKTMGGIGILIVFAAIIGKCLMDSGAADRIVRSFTRVFGEGRENYSLLASGFVLSIPVFFDTVFYLLAPLARAAYARTKQNYVLLVCSVAAGGVAAHSLVPPTPGPLLVAETLGVSIGLTMLVGIMASTVPVIMGGIVYARWIARRMPFVPGTILGVSEEGLETTAAKPDSALPGFCISCAPFVLPIVMLAGTSIMKPFITHEKALVWITVLGDKNLVFFLGALVAIGLLISQNRLGLRETMKSLEPAIASGAVIAFITCAGGAFGKVLASAGVGDVITEASEEWGFSLLIMAFLTASLLRIAQGSTTVAMITTAGIVAPALATVELSYNPVYLGCAIGFGGVGFSWMNDSGFWIFSQLTGLSEAQTLKTWSAILTIMAVTGILWTALLAKMLPLV